MRLRASCPLILATLGLFAGCGATPSAVEASATSDFAARTDAWHAERLAKLSAPDGWLSLVALAWLQEGNNRIGRASDAEVSYEGLPAEHVGTLLVDGGDVRFEAATGVAIEGVPDGGVLRTDAQGSPTELALGDIRFHVVVRGGRLAVRMKDAAAPTRTEFDGVERYPVDEKWRITAEFVPASRGVTVGLDTVIGVRSEAQSAGRARFEKDGTVVDAVLFRSGDDALLRFGDATNGDGTYKIGRYLYVDLPTDGRTVELDFNRAFNPPCAFTPYATCSLPVRSNVFPFDVTAGERWGAE